jgi:hypothetical protein
MSTKPTQPMKTRIYQSLYGVAKFLTWLAIGLAAYYAAVQLQTWYRESAFLKDTRVSELLVPSPALVIVGMISMVRFVGNMETIAGLVKFTVGWLLLCVTVVWIFSLTLVGLSATLGSTSIGVWVTWIIMAGGLGALIGYGVWQGRQKKEEDIRRLADLFVPIGRAGARFLWKGAVIGAVIGVGLQLLLNNEYAILMALTLIAMLVSLPFIISKIPARADVGKLCLLIAVGLMIIDGFAAIELMVAGYQAWGMTIILSVVLIGTLLAIARYSRHADAVMFRLSIGLGLIVVCGVAAVELMVVGLGLWGFALLLFAITVMAAMLVNQYNSTLSKSGGNNVDIQ